MAYNNLCATASCSLPVGVSKKLITIVPTSSPTPPLVILNYLTPKTRPLPTLQPKTTQTSPTTSPPRPKKHRRKKNEMDRPARVITPAVKRQKQQQNNNNNNKENQRNK